MNYNQFAKYIKGIKISKGARQYGKEKEKRNYSSAAEYLTFVASTGDSQDSVEMRCEDENIWLTQKMMATLYDVSVSAINQHIKKVFDDYELEWGQLLRNT